MSIPTQQISPHRRQFVIGSKQFFPDQNWCSHQLESSIWISYCPDLRVAETQDANGVKWRLLGLAIESQADKLDPLEEITRTNTSKVPEIYPSWAGRWVLIGDGQIHMDASGLLGCYYGILDRQMWVSSSPALLAQILFVNQATEIDPRPLQYEVGISWFTPPRSRFKGIFRLLPSQIVELKDNSIKPRPLMPKIDFCRSFEEILDRVKTSLVTTLSRLGQIESQLWLGMTAGYDSRLMLALSRDADINIQAFTRIATRMSVADRLLPPKLVRDCGYEHIFRKMGPRRPERKPLVAEHSAGHVSEGDAEPFIKGIREGMTGISFGGHGFSVASGFAHLRRLPNTVEDAEIGAKQIAKLFQEPIDSTATAGLRDWLDWVLQHPQDNLDWRDRFFIEQRQAGWLSSKEQVYDLAQLERFPILNCAYIYSLLLSLKEEQRLGSLVQKELIRQVAPELLQYPFNPNDFYFGMGRVMLSKSWELPQYIAYKVTGKLRWLWHSLTLKF